jgi:transposase InsO family protein
MDLSPRLRAVCDLDVAEMREYSGRHEAVLEAALAGHARLVAHVERAAAGGDPDAALGSAGLTALMSSAEALPVDVGRLAEQADAERDRLLALLADGCARLAPGRPDTHLSGQAALSEARRATFDPTYGRYTWGKLELLKLRERARKDWGPAFTLQRFHKALMDLGSPALGLLGTVLNGG